MPVTVTHLSRSLEGPGSFVWKYTARGSLVIDDIATALLAASPANYGFWLRQWDQKTIIDQGGGVWDCTLPYGVGDIPLVSIPSLPSGSSGSGTGGGSSGSSPPTVNDGDPLGREWSMEFANGSRVMTHSLYSFGGNRRSTLGEGGASFRAIPSTDKGASIGFNPDTNETKGTEVPTGVQRLELQLKVPVLTMGYVKLMRKLSSPPNTNSEAFLGFAAGEVKFLGGVVSWSQANGFSIRYQFDVGLNQKGYKVSDALPAVDVRAWEYLDVTYGTYLDPNGPAGKLISLPERYVVHRVLPESDLNQLFS